jgi:hypothetical protein
MRVTSVPALLVLALAAGGCGGHSTAEPRAQLAPGVSVPTSTAVPVGGTAVTWPDGTRLTGAVVIPAGTVVTLAKGATVTASKGASLSVAGELLAPAGGALTGTGWRGVSVARGGHLDLTGVSLSGGETALRTEPGALPSALALSRLERAGTPLDVAAGSALTLTDVFVSKVSGASIIKGSVTGTRLSYDKAGNPGIVVQGAASTLRLTDSRLFGNGEYEGDMITTSSAGTVSVTGTEVTGVHCAFHLVGVHALELDRDALHGNAFGFMAYGSDPGVVHHVRDTDVYDNRDFGLEESPGVEQGQILVDGGYWAKNGSSAATSIAQTTGKVVRTDPADSPRR